MIKSPDDHQVYQRHTGKPERYSSFDNVAVFAGSANQILKLSPPN
jgi:hypothetical protein